MRIYKKLFATVTAITLLISVTACANNPTSEKAQDDSPGTVTNNSQNGDNVSTGTSTSSQEIDIEFSAKDLDMGYNETDSTKISLNGDTAIVDGAGASFIDGVVEISSEGTYIVSGMIFNGRIMINAGENDKVKLVLKDATINCSDYSPIYVAAADKVFITLVGENTLSDGQSYTLSTNDANVDSTIFSRSDLTLNGTGTLNITASYKHAICSKDDLIITGGTYNLTAVGGGVYGKDCVKIASGIFNLKTGSDGIQSDNAEDAGRGYIYIKDGKFNVTAGTDGIQAETVLRIDGGEFSITTGGGSQNASTENGQNNPDWGGWGGNGRGGQPGGGNPPMQPGQKPQDPQSSSTSDTETASAKGLKSASELIVNGGIYTVDTSDDSLHSNNSMVIDGGIFTINSGDDGIHSDTSLLINNGDIKILKSYEGIESAAITIAGGTVNLTASDDGLNAAGGKDSSAVSGRPGQGMFSTSTGTMTLSGGNVTINSSGDGIDCNGPITMSGGNFVVFGPTNDGNGPMDYDGEFICNGGTLIALGSAGMAQGVSGGSNASLFVKISGAENSVFKVTDSNSNVICEVTSPKKYACALVTSPNLKKGTSYSFYINGAESGSQAAA